MALVKKKTPSIVDTASTLECIRTINKVMIESFPGNTMYPIIYALVGETTAQDAFLVAMNSTLYHSCNFGATTLPSFTIYRGEWLKRFGDVRNVMTLAAFNYFYLTREQMVQIEGATAEPPETILVGMINQMATQKDYDFQQFGVLELIIDNLTMVMAIQGNNVTWVFGKGSDGSHRVVAVIIKKCTISVTGSQLAKDRITARDKFLGIIFQDIKDIIQQQPKDVTKKNA